MFAQLLRSVDGLTDRLTENSEIHECLVLFSWAMCELSDNKAVICLTTKRSSVFKQTDWFIGSERGRETAATELCVCRTE